MNITFAEAITTLGGPPAIARIANQARTPADYLFASFLPERRIESYNVKTSSMTVRATMAGLVAMDTPYPPGGHVSLATFMEQTAKLALHVSLPEATLREIVALINAVTARNGDAPKTLATEVLNFLNKVIIQGMMDRDEWLRGQALIHAAIDWTFTGTPLVVDYGRAAGNTLPLRTVGNADAYHLPGSLFWTDMRAARSLLKQRVRAAVARSTTIDAIVENEDNNLEITEQTGRGFTVRRLRTMGGNTVPSADARDVITLVPYDREGEILDPATAYKTTLQIPFMEEGAILYVGENARSEYRVGEGEGSTDDPDNDLMLGYTHMAPTVEANGTPGRWAELYTPEREPWALHGRGAENMLPVIEAPNKTVVARTEMPA